MARLAYSQGLSNKELVRAMTYRKLGALVAVGAIALAFATNETAAQPGAVAAGPRAMVHMWHRPHMGKSCRWSCGDGAPRNRFIRRKHKRDCADGNQRSKLPVRHGTHQFSFV